MKSRSILTINAVVQLILGGVMLFLGDEILPKIGFIGIPNIIVMIVASLYLGFGLMNWYSRKLPVGGIYARPLVLGNLWHYMIGSFSLLKIIFSNPTIELGMLTVYYVIFALAFGWLMFKSPV